MLHPFVRDVVVSVHCNFNLDPLRDAVPGLLLLRPNLALPKPVDISQATQRQLPSVILDQQVPAKPVPLR